MLFEMMTYSRDFAEEWWPAIVQPYINQSRNVSILVTSYRDGGEYAERRVNPSDACCLSSFLRGSRELMSLLDEATTIHGWVDWPDEFRVSVDDKHYLLRGHIGKWLIYESAKKLCDIQGLEWEGCASSTYYSDCIRSVLDIRYSQMRATPKSEMSRPISRNVYTYFIHSPSLHAVKIGIAQNVKSRLSSLATGNPDCLTVLAEFNGDREKEFHDKFLKHRIKREWFQEAPVMEWLKRTNCTA